MSCPPRRVLALLSVLWMLSGCASWFAPSPGLFSVEISERGAIEVRDGREYAKVSGTFKRPDGFEGKFEALGVKAFEGQSIGAQQQIEQMQLVNTLLQALLAARSPSGRLLPLPPVP